MVWYKKLFSFKSGFRKQLLVIFTLSILILAMLTVITSSWFSNKQMRKLLIAEGMQVTENLAKQSLFALLYYSADNAYDAVTAALSFPGVSYINLSDKENKILLHKGTLKNEALIKSIQIPKNELPKLIYESAQAWHFIAGIFTPDPNKHKDNPLYIDNGKAQEFMGRVYVVVKKDAYNSMQTQVLISNISAALIITLLIVFFLHKTLKRITRPLDDLSCAMLKAQHGDQQVKAELKGPEEIVNIASTFNSMMQALEEKQSALFNEKEQALITLESIADGVITTDTNGHILYLNPIAEYLTGWKTQDITGLALDEVFILYNEQTHDLVENPISCCLKLGLMQEQTQHCMLRPIMASEIFIEDSVAPTRDHNGEITGTVMVFHDVTEARDMAVKMSYQATHDSLTGLINRSDFKRYMFDIIERLDVNTEHVLCYLDLDQFKVINDTCGHIAGDQLLKNISQLMSQKIRKTKDTLARLGGDEFVLLLENCSLQQAEKIAQSLCDAVQEYRFVWQDKPFTIGVSIGLVALNKHTHDFQDVLSKADSACYMAKEKGRNRVHSYLIDDDELMQRQSEMQVVSSITEAYENDMFQLFYQPIVSLDRPDILTEHYELLLRMQDNQGNWLSPGYFLPAAERYNLIHKVDRWVIRTAFNWLARNPEHLAQLKCCAINLSGMSLNDEMFFDFIAMQFKKTNVPAEKICFEITETAAISNLGNAIGFINRLRDLGCKSALDDFGSGMSSFAYLKNFPIDYLKIDGMFVKDIIHDPIDNAMVKSINDIGHVLGLQTIAEFVEDEKIMQRLKELGVNQAQGYHIAKPQPLDALLQDQIKPMAHILQIHSQKI